MRIEKSEPKPVAYPHKIEPLEGSAWEDFGRLHTALANLFKHPWSFAVTGFVEGKPSIHFWVLAPTDNVMMYDNPISDLLDHAMPEGYFFDGTDVDSEIRRGNLRERGYYLYPEKRGASD